MNVSSSHRGFRRVRAFRALDRGRRSLWRRLLPDWPFHRMLDRIDAALESGSLEAHLPDGTIRMLGGRAPGFACVVQLASWRPLIRLARSGSIGWYESWANREWSSPDPVPLFALFMANARALGGNARAHGLARLVGRIGHRLRANSRRGSRRNIAAHYDLGNDFYRLWLDAGMTYSSARPASVHEPLEAAQTRKLDAILDRLDLKPGDSLLEIGCGWGSLAERALERAPIAYTGLTLSAEQRDIVRERLAGHEAKSAQVLLQDYRDTPGQYDAIASVEMVEAVGLRYWPTYLAAIARLLKPGGKAAIQLISIDHALFPRYAASADFIQRYVFPGGCLIDEPRFRDVARAAGLEWTDESHFGLDYAWTLRKWRERFDVAVEAGELPPRFDARFVDLWRYYLMYCEGGFAGRGIDVMQVTLVRPLAAGAGLAPA